MIFVVCNVLIFLYVSGMLTELDAVMGPLSLTSSMSFLVRYTRQGVHWMRLDCQKVKWPDNLRLSPNTLKTFELPLTSPRCAELWYQPGLSLRLYFTRTSRGKRCRLVCVLKDRCTCYLLFSLMSTFSLWLSGTFLNMGLVWCHVIIGETGLLIKYNQKVPFGSFIILPSFIMEKSRHRSYLLSQLLLLMLLLGI